VFNRHCEERSDEAIQLRAKRAKQKSAAVAVTAVVIWRALPARSWIASLRSQ